MYGGNGQLMVLSLPLSSLVVPRSVYLTLFIRTGGSLSLCSLALFALENISTSKANPGRRELCKTQLFFVLNRLLELCNSSEIRHFFSFSSTFTLMFTRFGGSMTLMIMVWLLFISK